MKTSTGNYVTMGTTKEPILIFPSQTGRNPGRGPACSNFGAPYLAYALTGCMAPTLRSKLIRLAQENPALRPHLLPLLKTAGGAPINLMEHIKRAWDAREAAILDLSEQYGIDYAEHAMEIQNGIGNGIGFTVADITIKFPKDPNGERSEASKEVGRLLWLLGAIDFLSSQINKSQDPSLR